MATRKKDAQESKKDSAITFGHGLVMFADAFNRTREMIGVWGAGLFVYLLCFQIWGSAKEKEEFVSKVLLLHALDGIGPYHLLLGALVLGLLVALVVANYYRRLIKVKDRRIQSYENSIQEYRRIYPGVAIQPKLEDLEE